MKSIFFNRALSWIEFNERVLSEGLKKNMPPLERLKFLSIVSSNFDEFFMVRVAAIKQALASNIEAGLGFCPSGIAPAELLEKIYEKVRSIHNRQYNALVNEVFPAMESKGLRFRQSDNWTDAERAFLESLFIREIAPLLTPLRFEENEPIPSIGNHSLFTAFLLTTEEDEERVSIVQIPKAQARVIWLPSGREADLGCWVLLEDLVRVFGHSLYPGYKVKESFIFEVNRDADFSVDEQRDDDFIEAMVEVLEGRDRSKSVRMVHSPGSSKLRDIIAGRLFLEQEDLFEITGPLKLKDLYEFFLFRGFETLSEKSWKIYSHPAFSGDQPIWDVLSASDVILHLPYQSFNPVIRFFQESAADPQVVAIKTTLYRTSGDSPILGALEQASRAGKQVTAVVELKARFDEGRNISWANRLEKAGVIVIYGLAGFKIHAKATIVMRREHDRIKRYVHFSTGNYNEKTAKLYADLCLFTSREDIAYDAGLFFNMITGYSSPQSMSRLVIAPTALKRRLLELINREISRSRPESPGRIIAKMNALADRDIINALYEASKAGVEIMLNVRGICMLVPGVKGLSENIRVVSIVDHFLEHSRIYYFANGGAEEIFLASADWMTRNLDRRLELMFPVLQGDIRKAVFEILSAYFKDNSNAWALDAEGVWTRLEPEPGEEAFRVQSYFLSLAAEAQEKARAKAQAEAHPRPVRGEFIVRRRAPGDNLPG